MSPSNHNQSVNKCQPWVIRCHSPWEQRGDKCLVARQRSPEEGWLSRGSLWEKTFLCDILSSGSSWSQWGWHQGLNSNLVWGFWRFRISLFLVRLQLLSECLCKCWAYNSNDLLTLFSLRVLISVSWGWMASSCLLILITDSLGNQRWHLSPVGDLGSLYNTCIPWFSPWPKAHDNRQREGSG